MNTTESKELSVVERAVKALSSVANEKVLIEGTQAWVRAHLMYNPDTGVFTRRIAHSRTSTVGSVAGWRNGNGYIDIKIEGHTYKAHRLAWLYVYGSWPKSDIDHINLDRSYNGIANLREASRSENSVNREKGCLNKSGFKGVNFHKASNKWTAQSSWQKKKIYLGVFNTPEEASAVYKRFIQENHGEFARADGLTLHALADDIRKKREADAADAKQIFESAERERVERIKREAAEAALRHAGPALLEALEKMLDCFVDDPLSYQYTSSPVIEAARDAIAFARPLEATEAA